MAKEKDTWETAGPKLTLKQEMERQVHEAGGSVAVISNDPKIDPASEPDLGEWWYGEVHHHTGESRHDMVGLSGTDKKGRPFEFVREFVTGREIMLPQAVIDSLEQQIEEIAVITTTNPAHEAALRGNLEPAWELAHQQQYTDVKVKHGRVVMSRKRVMYRFIKTRPRQERIEVRELPG